MKCIVCNGECKFLGEPEDNFFKPIFYTQDAVPWTYQAKAIPLEDFKKIQLLGRKIGAGNWDQQVSDNASRNLPEPSTDPRQLFMTTGMDGDE